MADNDAEVRFGGDVSELVEGMANAKEAVVGSVEGMVSALGGFQNKLVELIAIIGGGELFREAVNSFQEMGAQANQLIHSIGLTSEEIAGLHQVLGESGTSLEAYSSAYTRFNRTLRTNQEQIQSLGVDVAGFNAGQITSKQLFEQALVATDNYSDGIARTQVQMELFGRRGSDVSAIIRAMQKDQGAAREEAKALGLVWTEADEKARHAFIEMKDGAKDAFEGIEKVIAEAVLPVLTEFASWMKEEGPAAVSATRESMRVLMDVFSSFATIAETVSNSVGPFFEAIANAIVLAFGDESTGKISAWSFIFKNLAQFVIESGVLMGGAIVEISYVLQQLGTVIAQVAAAWVQFITGNWEGAKAAWAAGTADIEANEKAHADKMVKIETDANTSIAKLWKETGKVSSSPGLEPSSGLDAPDRAKAVAQNKALIAEQIKDYESLQAAIRKAWETAISDEQKYIDKATALRAKAADLKEAAANKAQDKQFEALAKDDQGEADLARSRASTEALQQAQFDQAHAYLENQAGNTKAADAWNTKADEQIKRATQLADAIKDTWTSQNALNEVGAAASNNLELQAQMEEAKAAKERENQEGLRKQLADTETTVKNLQAVADNLGRPIKINIDTDTAKNVLDSLLAQIEQIKSATKDIKIPLGVGGAGSADGTGKYQLDVSKSIPQFSAGASGGQTTPVIINMGNQSFPMQADKTVAGNFADAMRMQALKQGAV